MKTSEIRALDTPEIQARLSDAREEYFRLRMQFTTGQLHDHARLHLVRRDIARLSTIWRERELAAAMQGSRS